MKFFRCHKVAVSVLIISLIIIAILNLLLNSEYFTTKEFCVQNESDAYRCTIKHPNNLNVNLSFSAFGAGQFQQVFQSDALNEGFRIELYKSTLALIYKSNTGVKVKLFVNSIMPNTTYKINIDQIDNLIRAELITPEDIVEKLNIDDFSGINGNIRFANGYDYTRPLVGNIYTRMVSTNIVNNIPNALIKAILFGLSLYIILFVLTGPAFSYATQSSELDLFEKYFIFTGMILSIAFIAMSIFFTSFLFFKYLNGIGFYEVYIGVQPKFRQDIIIYLSALISIICVVLFSSFKDKFFNTLGSLVFPAYIFSGMYYLTINHEFVLGIKPLFRFLIFVGLPLVPIAIGFAIVFIRCLVNEIKIAKNG